MRTHYPMHPYTHELADKRGRADLVRDPGLRAQDREPRQAWRDRRSPPRSSRRTSSPTRTTRRCCCGRSPTSCPRGPARRRRTTSRTPSARPRRSTRAAPSASPSPATRRSAARRPTRRSTSSASTTTSAGTPARSGLDLRPHEAVRLPRLGPRLLPEAGRDGHRVRRRGQPRRPGGGEGHVGLPAGLRQLPPRHLRVEDVAQRRGLLGAQRVQGAPGLGGRQPAPEPAAAPEGPAAGTATSHASPRGRTCAATTPRTKQFG